jgi:hypothetical protein
VHDFLVGLAIAAVTGITFLAYQHPKVYAFADELLHAIGFAALTGAIGYSAGFGDALSFVSKRGSVPEGAWAQIPDPILASVAWLVFCVYLKFLKDIVSNMKESDRQGNDNDNGGIT